MIGLKKILLLIVASFLFIFSNTSAMNQSLDLDLDGMNDCEFNNTCDDSVDYTKAKIYLDKNEFLKDEGQICISATDGCNTIGVSNGQFTFSTEMWCEDTYGEKGREEYSCKAYDEDKIENMKYIRKNISILITDLPAVGGKWYVTGIDWKSDNEIIVNYEDGHYAESTILNLEIIKKSQTSNSDDVRICTMQYAPVCAEVQVQCIKAPCYPVQETFGNSCMAGDNKILYKGECSDYVNIGIYNKYIEKQAKFIPVIQKLPTKNLDLLIEVVDQRIETTKLLRIARFIQEQKITAYVFLKDLINNELSNR